MMTDDEPEKPAWTHEAWTPAKREAVSQRYIDAELDQVKNGVIPDEQTIYNVLCPQIREGWSQAEKHKRRASYFRQVPAMQSFIDA